MSNASKSTNNFARALKAIRKSKGLSQEDFSLASSRTYVSTLERSMKSPTLSKIDDLAQVLGVHPLTLLTLAYLLTSDEAAVNKVLSVVTEEISELK
ncbi:MAG: helix-turn-helix transcriptional regulator [Polaromonas sp.]|uniref:helix-turn-helix domain-containing protein n=1 Tax=Polaromonas sp. TaxID=1869339 RepID=UPI0025CD1B54|nr:helix-turn-helix transcriptional regulator [Polaromonas sp.]MBI2728512.1 helix-turn-helix transcriptional regulator [Polaromonas sp.]